MKRKSEYEKLLDACKEQGFDKVLNVLENINRQTENMQCYLFGDPETVKKAAKMGLTIIQQNITIANLKKDKELFEATRIFPNL